MKTAVLALAALLTGCSTHAPEKPVVLSQAEKDRAAVAAYLQESLNDPGTYQAVAFEGPKALTRADSLYYAKKFNPRAEVRPAGVEDSVRIGRQYLHKYRAKNAFGGVVLQQDVFAVYNNGTAGRFTAQ